MIENQSDNRNNLGVRTSDIAIIGMACRFPESDNYNEFWSHLEKGDNLIKEIDDMRWDTNQYYSPILEADKSISKWCGRVDRMEYFDNHFFKISPREALVMDPHQRQLLEIAWQCIEDAGLNIKQLQRGKTAVYMNASHNDYGLRAYAVDREVDSYTNLGNYQCISANRISYAFGLTGQSLSVEAACAASLVAVNEGVRALRSRECDYVLVGSANYILHQGRYISYSKARMLSPEGQCKTFDANADGYVPGEGAGVLLLQRLEDAVAQRNHIHAVIKAAKASHIGEHISITAPKVSEQEKLILSAYAEAGFTPETVGYVEAHGTGTPLGDPIEVEGLTRAFREYTKASGYCKIGSVKTNIGHLEGTSGLAGLIKTVLMMKNHKIAKTLNIKQLNPIINFKATPFIPADNLSDWQRLEETIPLRAGISSYGFGGAGCHVLLEEYQPEKKAEASGNNKVFLLSAKSSKSLAMLIDSWRNFVTTREFQALSFHDILGTAMASRSGFRFRYGIKAENKEELIKSLKDAVILPKKASYDRWLLILCDLKLTGFCDFKKLYEAQPIFRVCLEGFRKWMKAGEWNGLLKRKWKEADKKLYSFMVTYSFAVTLQELGIPFTSIASSGMGFWAALGISGILEPEDILHYLMGKRESNSLCFHRPNITFLDYTGVIGNKVNRIMPYQITGINLKKLLDGIQLEFHDFIEYQQKAGILYHSVPSFRKLLEEWNNPLAQAGMSIKELLFSEYTDFQGSKEQLLMIVLLSSSLRRLNQKWDLRMEELNCTSQFTELLTFVEDNLIRKEELVQLFGSEAPDFEAIANNISERLQGMGKKYKLTEVTNHGLTEIKDYETWLNLLDTSETTYEKEPEANVETILVRRNATKELNQKTIKEPEELSGILTDLVLKAWLMGASINWEKVVPEELYDKVPLPVYEFDQSPFLLPLNGKKLKLEKSEPLRVKAPEFEMKDRRVPEIKTSEMSAAAVNELKISDLQMATEEEAKDQAKVEVLLQRKVQTEAKAEEQTEKQDKAPVYFTTEDTIIRDHIITGVNLIPGAFMLKLLADKLIPVNQKSVITFRNVYFMKPGIVMNKTSVIPQLENNRFRLAAEEEILSKGEYCEIEDVPQIPVNMASINSYPQINFEGLYRCLFSMGYQYGESLQVIQKIWRINNGYFIRLMEQKGRKSRQLSAELLDGAIQSILAAEYVEGNLNLKNTIWIPFKISEITIMGELKGTCYAAIDKANIQKQDGNIIASFEVFNEEGIPVISMEGLCLKACPKDFLQKAVNLNKKNEAFLYHYKPFWVKDKLKIDDGDSGINSKCAVVFAKDEMIYEAIEGLSRGKAGSSVNGLVSDNGRKNGKGTDVIAGILEKSYEKVYIVLKGSCFKEQDKVYSMNVKLQSDYIALLESLKNHSNDNMQYDMYYLWANQTEGITEYNTSSNKLEEIEEEQVQAIFHLLHTMVKIKIGKVTNLIIGVTDSRIVVDKDKGNNFIYGGLEALVRSIRQETPRVSVTIIDFEAGAKYQKTEPDMISDMFMELKNKQKDSMVAYRGNDRYVRGLAEAADINNSNLPLLEDGDTYLVIGGLGGIGRKLVQQICELVKANILIVGTSSLDSVKKEQLIALNQNKTRACVDYYQCNITNKREAEVLINKIKDKYKNIQGVIHCGGINHDKLLISKEWEEFKEVLRPKTIGTSILNEVTAKEPLKFFAAFSSVVSITGNVGQSDYAYANGVLDAFMDYRRQNPCPGRSIGINWTLWENTGMGKDSAAIQNFVNKTGMISPEAGTKDFLNILTSEVNQVIVVADKEKFESFLSKNHINCYTSNMEQM